MSLLSKYCSVHLTDHVFRNFDSTDEVTACKRLLEKVGLQGYQVIRLQYQTLTSFLRSDESFLLGLRDAVLYSTWQLGCISSAFHSSLLVYDDGIV